MDVNQGLVKKHLFVTIALEHLKMYYVFSCSCYQTTSISLPFLILNLWDPTSLYV